MNRPTDPIEAMVFDALVDAGVKFEMADENKARLDFFLPGIGVYVEVKQFHSPRIAEQMSRAKDVIAIQGRWAAAMFCGLLKNNVPAHHAKGQD